MDPQHPASRRVVWAFWIAALLVAVGGVVPLLLAGTSGRISGVIIPFWIAAIALGACAMFHGQSRAIATGLYFIAGLAIVYGILAMLAVPLRLAVIGTCPPAPAQCALGYEPQMTDAENTGLGFATGMGIVSVLVGFFGLVVFYRRLAAASPGAKPTRRILGLGGRRPAEPAAAPPTRRIPPVAPTPSADPAAAASPEAVGPSEPVPATPPAVEETPELPAPEPQLELAAPAAEPELPPHLDDPPGGEAGVAPAAPARPKRKRGPRAASGAPPSDTSAT
ncbi:MAG TPA: hypothetical protein VET26_03090 [Candidatus Sulfotelmatobacter sp.]|nr:hypothetical protein [Candidatus Sulfotelmatobacter sp.]